MNKDRIIVGELLIDVECELRRLDVWEDQFPPDEALASSQPFAVDTLSFTQWLQFIFIPKIRLIVESKDALPQKCDVAPMAEEHFRGQGMPVDNLIRILKNVDEVITRAS